MVMPLLPKLQLTLFDFKCKQMSTNYYFKPTLWSTQVLGMDDFHLGKSSAGWCFSLSIDNPLDITNYIELAHWIENQEKSCRGFVYDEYGRHLPASRFREVVENRFHSQWSKELNAAYWEKRFPSRSEEQRFMEMNYAVRGPRGLLRHRIDGVHCVGHGDGTWDLIKGTFC